MSLPSIAGIVLSPPQIASLALEDDGRVERGSIGTDTFNDGDKIPIAALNLLHNLLITVDESADPVADPKLDALSTRLKHAADARKLNHFLIHVPQILGLDVVLLDGIREESEVVVDNRPVQGLSTTLFKAAGPFDFEVRATLFEACRPGHAKWSSVDLGCVGPDGRQTERNSALPKALLEVRYRG
jgi:hypothetical protein